MQIFKDTRMLTICAGQDFLTNAGSAVLDPRLIPMTFLKTFRLWAYRCATAEHSRVANDGSDCYAVNSRLRSKNQPDVGAVGLNGRRIGRYRCKRQARGVVPFDSGEAIVSDIQPSNNRCCRSLKKLHAGGVVFDNKPRRSKR